MEDQKEELTDPREMRKAMREMSIGFGGSGDDGMLAPLVCRVLSAGRYMGWSGEDTYTALAWQLLQAGNRYAKMVLDQERYRMPTFIMPSPPWLPMESAPKDREVLLRIPAHAAWDVDSGAWRGHWMATRKAWGLGSRGRDRVAIPVDPQPTGWMELPPA